MAKKVDFNDVREYPSLSICLISVSNKESLSKFNPFERQSKTLEQSSNVAVNFYFIPAMYTAQ
jgi:hypothetical protein